MSLSKILMIGLFRSNCRMVILSKTEKKKKKSYQKRKGPYIYDVHMERDEGVLKCFTCLQILFLINKSSVFHFCGWKGVTKLVIFCGRYKCMPSK